MHALFNGHWGEKVGVLPLDDFLKKGLFQFKAVRRIYTFAPRIEDDVVFITQQVATVGSKSSTVLQLNDANSS